MSWWRRLWLPSLVKEFKAANHAQHESTQRLRAVTEEYTERTRRAITTPERLAELGGSVQKATKP